MQYKPTLKTHYAITLFFAFSLFTIILFMVSASVNLYRWIYQATALAFTVCAVQILVRYLLTDYLYVIDNENFVIYKIVGKKRSCVCSLSLKTTMYGILTKKELDEKKLKFDMNLDYCKNIYPEDRCYFIFEFNGKKTCLCFEPSDEFKHLFNLKINEYMGKI